MGGSWCRHRLGLSVILAPSKNVEDFSKTVKNTLQYSL